jgi:hypothetical protein
MPLHVVSAGLVRFQPEADAPCLVTLSVIFMKSFHFLGDLTSFIAFDGRTEAPSVVAGCRKYSRSPHGNVRPEAPGFRQSHPAG